MDVALAFYRGKGDWRDRLIRFVTRSPYSHCEMVFDGVMPDMHSRCWSASPRDGGVRQTWIAVDSGHWDVVPIAFPTSGARELFESQDGIGYDWFGLIFSQFFNLRRHRTNRWFCSEICAAALGLPNPEKYAPGDLQAMVEWLNERV